MNSKVSKQKFCERYAQKALSVHGGGAVFANTSCNVGRRGKYGEMLSGLEGGEDSLKDMDSTKEQGNRVL
jgi:hypothetical protein